MSLFPCSINEANLNMTSKIPPVAKLDIAADSDSEGRGFESLQAGHWKPLTRKALGVFPLPRASP